MKPQSAFFIGTDGELKYFSMPEKETLYCDCRDCHEASERRYSKAIEVAKTEAVDIHDMYVYQVLMHRYFPHYIDYSKTPKDNFNMYATRGHVYPISMDQDIEVVDGDVHTCPSCTRDCYTFREPCKKKVARIIPKEPPTGIQLIAIEREEQLKKHNRTVASDVELNSGYQLSTAAARLIVDDAGGYWSSGLCPEGWSQSIWDKMTNKSYKERLIIAGALIAAEIDRINASR